MTCSTCGRENPAHLTFCQECGQRLAPRIAPPTPPIGIGAPDPGLHPNAYAVPPVVPGRAATTFEMPQRRPTDPPKPYADPTPLAPPVATTERRCAICDTVNAPNLRYCTSCGSTLDPQPVAAAARPPEPLAPVAPPFAPAPGIAPVAVNAAPAPPAELPRTCGRCSGAVDIGAQFCKFCGNPLAEIAPAPVALGPALGQEPLRVNGGGGLVPNSGVNRPPTAPTPHMAVPIVPPAARPVPSPSPFGPARSAPAPVAPAVAVEAPPRGPAASPTRGRLVVIAKSGADGASYPFGDVLDVGRVEGNVVIGEDPYLSPRHARLVWEKGKLLLRDLASVNGVFVRLAPRERRSGEPTEVSVPLHDGDVVLVGQQVFRFEVLREADAGLGQVQEHGTLLFGSPAAPRYARLCQRTVEGITRDVHYIRKPETVLGRESGDVVFTEDPFLSRRHAAIRFAAGDDGRPAPGELRFSLVDLGSSNGTFLRIKGDMELAPGDHFRVGQQLFRVDLDGARG
jgi:pSer/pThr/pTyr-binding forkhead associated (FHA) protein